MQRRARLDTSRSALVAVALGGTGTGKTSAVRAWLPAWEKRFRRIVVCDPRGQFEPEARERGLSRGMVRDLVRFLETDRPGIAFVSTESDASRRFVGEALWYYGDCLVIADEFQLYGTASDFIYKAWKLILTEGRSYGLSVVAITQRTAIIPKIVLTSATDVIAFRSTMPADVAYVRSLVGDGSAVLPRLPNHRAIRWGSHPDLFPGGEG